MKKVFFGIVLALFLAGMLAFPSTHVSPVYAAATTVSVTNALTGSNTTIASLHDSFTINVTIENSPANLAGYQFILVWNASILNCTSYTITPPQEWDSNWYAASNKLNRTNPNGTQSYYTEVVSTAGHVNIGPNHVVNTFNFTVMGTGETELLFPTFSGGNVVLGDWYANSIPVTVVSGLFETLIGPIYILADGSVSPSNAPILQNGNIYTLTGNIATNTTGITVQKSNIIVDGAGYTLNGSGQYTDEDGFNLTGVNNVAIKNMTITSFTFGILLDSSSNNTVSGNNVAANHSGIALVLSSSSTISGNNITNNANGIVLSLPSNGNIIYHNNFVNSTAQVSANGPPNVWDDGYPSGGNYWSDYLTRYPNAAENDRSGIWNMPYVIDANNTDYYPLMTPYGIYSVNFTEQGLPSGTTWWVSLNGDNQSSTSNVIEFFLSNGTYTYSAGAFDYTASPPTGSVTVNGANLIKHETFTVITYSVNFAEEGLPSGTTWWVSLNGNNESSTSNTIQFFLSNGNYTYSAGAFGYGAPSPSAGSVTVNGANVTKNETFTVIPEFPSFLILPLMMMATLLAVAIYRRKHLQT